MAIPLKYNIRSLLVRRVSTAMTAGGIASTVWSNNVALFPEASCGARRAIVTGCGSSNDPSW